MATTSPNTDLSRDSYFTALKDLLPGIKRLGIEFDETSVDLKMMLEEHFPGVELFDCAASAMSLRTIKSANKHGLICKDADMCAVGGRVLMQAVKPGVPKHEIALASTSAMVCSIAESFPFV